MVKDEPRSAHSGRVLADQMPLALLDVEHVEVALQVGQKPVLAVQIAPVPQSGRQNLPEKAFRT